MIIRLLIALLLLAAVPAMAAEDQTPAAPKLAQQQVRDTLLEQLQRQVGEAQTRAGEAERRERDAEIKRLADQARQAQTGLGQAEQRARDAEQQLLILQKISEQGNDAYARFEIIVSVSIGFFASLITVLVIFFALRTEKTAIAEAVKGVGDEIKARLTEVDTLVEKIRDHETQASRIVASLSPGEAPKSPEDRKTIADAARDARAKPPRDRTANEFRAIIIDLFTQAKWVDMLTAAQQMRLLHEGDDDFGFARFNEAYALGKLGRQQDAIAAYDAVIERYDSKNEPELREWAVIARVNKGVELAQSEKLKEAIDVWDDVIQRYEDSTEPTLQAHVINARFKKAHVLGQLGRRPEAIAVYDAVITRHEASTAPELQEWVARALVNKGVEIALSEQFQKAIDIWDDVIQRFGASEVPALQEHVANALYNKASALMPLGQYGAVIAACDDLIERYDQDERPEMREIIRSAYFYKARAYARMGQTQQAFSALQAMHLAGYLLDFAEIEQHSDFDSIRKHPDFKKFRDDYKGQQTD